jgi:hypothetical protein
VGFSSKWFQPANLFQGVVTSRRYIRNVLALVAVFGFGAFASNQITNANAQPAANAPPNHGKCVCLSAVHPSNLISPTIFRAFEDGTVEQSNGRGEWAKVGK